MFLERAVLVMIYGPFHAPISFSRYVCVSFITL